MHPMHVKLYEASAPGFSFKDASKWFVIHQMHHAVWPKSDSSQKRSFIESFLPIV